MADFTDFVASRLSVEETQATIHRYCEALCGALMMDAPEGYSFVVETARKYHKLIMVTKGGARSIHAFVDVKTGDVLKPASFKAPAKGVRYNMLNPMSRENMFSRAGWCNHYLYNRI